MARNTITRAVLREDLPKVLQAFLDKIKSTFQTLGNLVTAWGSTPSDTKYPSEKLVKTSLDAKAADSAVLHKAGLETASGQKWFEGGFCVFNKSNVGYGHYTLPGTGIGDYYNNWPEEYKDGAHFREWRLSFNTGINFWGKIRITIATSYSSFNASGSMQKTINCAFITANVFNNTGYYNDLGINTEKEFRISDLIWNNTTACWEIKIHSIKPTSNNAVPVLLIEFWTYSTTNRDSALGIHWVSATPDIVTDTTYYTKRSGNASTSPGTGGEQFNWGDAPVQQSPYGYEIFNRSHIIPVSNGGTGKTTALAANNALISPGANAKTDIVDDTNWLFRYDSPSDSIGAVYYRKSSLVWNWIKGKISSVLGLSESGYTGNADTATTATTAAGYTSGGAIDTALQGKVDKVSGKGLSTNDFTTDEKDKLAGIASGAEVNVQSDWNQTTTTADDYIKNKPQNLVQDASYVHTDNNYTTADKNKVAYAVQPGDLGTAAYKDVPESGDATNSQVVLGNDSRLSDARPASDVSAWAKAATKPTYTASEVGAAESSHQHSTSDITSGTLPVGRGGTGKTSVTAGNYLVGNGTDMLTERTPTAVGNNVLTNLPSGSADVLGTDYIIGSNHTSGATDTTQFVRRTADKLWNYIKTKIYNGILGSNIRPVFWNGSNLGLSKPSPNVELMGTVGKTTAAAARADTDELENTTINCNNSDYRYLNAMKLIPNVPYTFLIPSVNANKSGLVTSTKLTVYQIGASHFDLGTGATLYLDKAGGTSSQHEIVFAYRVGTTLYVFHQY